MKFDDDDDDDVVVVVDFDLGICEIQNDKERSRNYSSVSQTKINGKCIHIFCLNLV
jgi:hypothetical protein